MEVRWNLMKRLFFALFAVSLFSHGCAPTQEADAPATQILNQELAGLVTLAPDWRPLGKKLVEGIAETDRTISPETCIWVQRALDRTCRRLEAETSAESCDATAVWYRARGEARCSARLSVVTVDAPLARILRFDLVGPYWDGPVCGDATINGQESCDDGNLVAGDGCDAQCELEICGDGLLSAGEGCDDGNLASDDGCSSVCIVEACGDGVLQGAEGCDDGNGLGGDGCSPACQLEACGNSVLDVGESCDDGNLLGADGCSALCAWEMCGNGILDPFEDCEQGDDGCTWMCTDGMCADWNIQPGVTCAPTPADMMWENDGDWAPPAEWADLPPCDRDCLEGLWGGCERSIQDAFEEAHLAFVDKGRWRSLRGHVMVYPDTVHARVPIDAQTCQAAAVAGTDACGKLMDLMPDAGRCTAASELAGRECTVRLNVDFIMSNPRAGIHTAELGALLQFTLNE